MRFTAVSTLLILLGCGIEAPVFAQEKKCEEGAGPGTEYFDRSYRPQSQLRRHLLDLYLPADEPPVPLFIWVHGGAWRMGSKDKVPEPVADLVNHGYAVASINYRLSNWAWPAQIADVKAAIRWLRTNHEQYGLDPDSFAIGGASAGGHLAALAGTSAGDFPFPDDAESQVQAVCDFFGPTDFLQADAHASQAGCGPEALCHGCPCSPENELLDCCPAIGACLDKVAEANPITYVDGTDRPFFIAHGLSDCTIPPGQSELLHQALLDAGVVSVLVEVEDAGHNMGEVATDGTVDLMLQFLNLHLRECVS